MVRLQMSFGGRFGSSVKVALSALELQGHSGLAITSQDKAFYLDEFLHALERVGLKPISRSFALVGLGADSGATNSSQKQRGLMIAAVCGESPWRTQPVGGVPLLCVSLRGRRECVVFGIRIMVHRFPRMLLASFLTPCAFHDIALRRTYAFGCETAKSFLEVLPMKSRARCRVRQKGI